MAAFQDRYEYDFRSAGTEEGRLAHVDFRPITPGPKGIHGDLTRQANIAMIGNLEHGGGHCYLQSSPGHLRLQSSVSKAQKCNRHGAFRSGGPLLHLSSPRAASASTKDQAEDRYDGCNRFHSSCGLRLTTTVSDAPLKAHQFNWRAIDASTEAANLVPTWRIVAVDNMRFRLTSGRA